MQNGHQEQLKETFMMILQTSGRGSSLTNWWEADKCGGWLWGKPTQHALPASGRWSWTCLCGLSSLHTPPCIPALELEGSRDHHQPVSIFHPLGRNDGCRAVCISGKIKPDLLLRLLGRAAVCTGVATELGYKSGVRGDQLTRGDGLRGKLARERPYSEPP